MINEDYKLRIEYKGNMKSERRDKFFITFSLIFMCYAVFPLAYLHIVYQVKNPWEYFYFYHKLLWVIGLVTYLYMFLGIIFLIPGLNLAIKDKIGSYIVVALVLGVFWYGIVNYLFGPAYLPVGPPQ